MRGKPNTQIVLTVLRKGESKALTFNVTRAVIKTQSVKYKLSEPGYPYIRITQFQEHTGEDLAKAIKALHDENKGPFKGLILDLRNNPGGLLNAAVGVSAAFLPKNELVVYTEGRTEDAKMRLTADPENYVKGGAREDYQRDLPAELKTVPMVVLINGGSASASEIVAGALQDHQRAVILGTQSFGKGSVQTILPMNNGTAIKLTTARYYTPKGRSIQAKGIVPDIGVEEGTISTAEHIMNLREADLTHHLANPNDPESATPPVIEPPKVIPPGEPKDKADDKAAPLEPGSASDYQFNQALNLLKGLQILRSK
jgi:carboxyl-terminal processing protease